MSDNRRSYRVLAVLLTGITACRTTVPVRPRHVADGTWGGNGIGVFADSTGVSLTFDCAGGRIAHRIALDTNGAFDVTGTFAGAGNMRDADHSPHPARYSGHASATELTLTRLILDRADSAVSFRATLGATPHTIAC
jgi:hypothetical protein